MIKITTQTDWLTGLLLWMPFALRSIEIVQSSDQEKIQLAEIRRSFDGSSWTKLAASPPLLVPVGVTRHKNKMRDGTTVVATWILAAPSHRFGWCLARRKVFFRRNLTNARERAPDRRPWWFGSFDLPTIRYCLHLTYPYILTERSWRALALARRSLLVISNWKRFECT